MKPLLQWKSNKPLHILCVCVCLCSFRKTACKAHAPCTQYMACLALQYFSTLFHKRNGFRETLLDLKCVFWFSLQVLSGTFLILRRTELDMIKHVYRSSRKIFLSQFNENWTLLTDIRTHSNIKFHKNPSGGSWILPCGRTDAPTRRNY